jgi:2-C-methyl-D-erythritol 2,4-cyclodiphosphate synthase
MTSSAFRIGQGYDVHALVAGRDLILGGVKIPHEKGLLGHSDADVLIHAICDAILGAAALGDIGQHFPDTDQTWKGADSKVLLQKTISLVHARGWELENVDSSLCLEKPKVMKYAPQMKATLAPLLQIPEDCISIKATTNEQMGFIGREEGLVAYAVVLLKSKE